MIEVSITFGQGASLFLLLWYVRSEGATELMITPSNAFYLQYAINSCLEGFIDLTHRMRLSGMAQARKNKENVAEWHEKNTFWCPSLVGLNYLKGFISIIIGVITVN
jgi:hypothetical protein